MVSYEFPIILYNINLNNNILDYTIDNNDYKIQIDIGNYEIDKLVEEINNKSENKLKLEINKQNYKITINCEEIVLLKNNKSSILNNLGFHKKRYNNKKIYISENIYNLNNSKYIKLLIKNIDENIFAQINIESNRINNYSKLINNSLNNIEIQINDNNNNLINFNNQSFILEFNIFFLENNYDIDSDDISNITIENNNIDSFITTSV